MADQRTHYAPYHRNEKYPKQVVADFRKMKPPMLKKYIDMFELVVRPDSAPADQCIVVARHFDSHLEVDEDEVLARFVNAVRASPPDCPPTSAAPSPRLCALAFRPLLAGAARGARSAGARARGVGRRQAHGLQEGGGRRRRGRRGRELRCSRC